MAPQDRNPWERGCANTDTSLMWVRVYSLSVELNNLNNQEKCKIYFDFDKKPAHHFNTSINKVINNNIDQVIINFSSSIYYQSIVQLTFH